MTPATEGRGTPLRAVKKRRFEEESYSAEAEYDVDTTAMGDIEITEDDGEGKFIILTNKGDKVWDRDKIWQLYNIIIWKSLLINNV